MFKLVHNPTAQDLDYATVADMVRFIYAGRLSDMAPKAGTLLSAAEKYDIRDLKEICCNHLSANLNTEQVGYSVVRSL